MSTTDHTARNVLIVIAGLYGLRVLASAYVNGVAITAQAQAQAAQAATGAATTASNNALASNITGDATGLLAAVINAGAQN